jgi:hypothetical protein
VRVLAGIPSVDYRALYPVKVLKSKPNNRADVRADDERIGALSNVNVWLSTPDTKIELEGGSRMLLGFAEGDPSKPYLIAFEQGSGGFSSLEIGSSGLDCARKTDEVRVTIPPGTVMVPNPAGGPPIPNPVPITLNGTITGGSSKVKVA